MSQALIIIPSRLQASRLPHKPLAEIAGKPMILHVWDRACQANAGPVVVATADPEIQSVVEAAGGTAILTDPHLKSGTDRVRVAAALYDAERKYPLIVNVQGDLPLLEPFVVQEVLKPLLEESDYAIGTVATPLRPGEKERASVVKIALTQKPSSHRARALYFSRSPIPFGTEEGWHHIGVYAYRREALERFVQLPPSPLESAENLEQLRALEAGMAIGVQLLSCTPPLGVDTPEDLEAVRKISENRLS